MTNELTTKNQDVAVREYEHRIAEFLPGAKDVPHPILMAMAQVAIAHGLDPFLKEVWPIPQKNRNGEIVGWDLMIGIAGWRSSAWRSNEYWGRHFEKCTPEERGWLGAQPNDIAIKCIVYRRRTGQKPMEFDGYGLFRVGHEYTKMNPLQCARYRAERDAMKAAFPISLPAGISAKVAEEETGEIINGSHDVDPKWDVITKEDTPPIEQVKTEPNALDELTSAAEAALIAGVLDTDAGEPERLRNAIKSAKHHQPEPQTVTEQWPSDYESFCTWMMAHGYNGKVTRQVFGMEVREWLKQNPIESFETAAMNVKAVMSDPAQ